VRQASAGRLGDELADVVEVLHAIAEANGLSWDRVLEIATRKRIERGAFDNRIFLEYVEQSGYRSE
jgi:predicted house-cleaning noncanonical NTP pyrophosphatase (MazG superfamily)